MSDAHLPQGHISITTGTIVRCALVIALCFAVYFLRDVILLILTSVVIASAIEPMALALVRRHVHRTIAVILIFAFVILVFGGLIFFFVPLLVDDIGQFTELFPRIASNPGFLEPLFERFPDLFRALQEGISPSDIFPGFSGYTNIGEGVVSTARWLFGGLFGLVLTIVLSFYLAVQEAGVENFLRLICPPQHESYVVSLWQRSRRKIGLWMQGQLLLGLLIGIFVYLGLALFGIKYALLLAILAAVFEIIPVFGPILAAVPGVVVGFTYGITTGFFILAFYIIIQQFENHLIYPLVVRKIIGIPPLLSIIAIVIGAELGGFLGIILAVPLATIFVELIGDFEKHKKSLLSHT